MRDIMSSELLLLGKQKENRVDRLYHLLVDFDLLLLLESCSPRGIGFVLGNLRSAR
jgi:hypothetical protein